MKVDKNIIASGPPVAQGKVIYCDFKDKAIDKLYFKSGDRVTVKFNNIKVSFLTGLILRYSPKTQKKDFIQSINTTLELNG